MREEDIIIIIINLEHQNGSTALFKPTTQTIQLPRDAMHFVVADLFFTKSLAWDGI